MTKDGYLVRCLCTSNNRTTRTLLKGLVAVFLIVGLWFILLIHSFLSQVPSRAYDSNQQTALPMEEIWFGAREKDTKLDVKETLAALKGEILELQRIKVAALNDLRDLEGKRYSYQEVVKTLSASKINLLNEVKISERGLSRLKNELHVLQSAVDSKKFHVNIPIGKPKQLKYISNKEGDNKETLYQASNNCLFSSCFDFSNCPLLEPFSIFVYKPTAISRLPIDFEKTNAVYREILKLKSVSVSSANACLFLKIIVLQPLAAIQYEKGLLSRYLNSLDKWESNGKNHLVIFLSKDPKDTICNYLAEIARTNAIVATSTHCFNSFRENFDMLLFPADLFLMEERAWDSMPQLVPIRRKYLFTLVETSYGHKVSNTDLIALRGTYVDIYVKAGCYKTDLRIKKEFLTHCKDKEPIENILKQSIFNILYAAEQSQQLGDLLRDIVTSLVNGAIPVIMGKITHLPFSEFIDYRKFIIFIPRARVTEAHYILRTTETSHIFAMRKHGRFIYETYFSSLKANLMTIFSAIRSRTNLPPIPLMDWKAVSLFANSTLFSNKKDLERGVIKSNAFDSNWTSTNINIHEHWNVYPGAHYLLKYIPHNNALPPSVQFFEDINDFMPIGNGEGGDGNVFKNTLGGDKAYEHFTVVILTYDRELILVESLQRLANLKFLNRVIVIWNNPEMPSKELEWPDIGVPVHVIKGEKNSLNNRFIPFDLIDTEAILSMDDDIYLREDEIELAFRIWRENRDRIVGFPGRFHSWNSKGGWSYNANHSCELSMVLTGGAFFHKYYSYLYTYLMPQAIRNTVDEYMNCEDIAMNFLVAHVTGRPPIKVTSRWTFRCPGCPTSLSNDNTHYTERHKCLQYFKKIYGYMPLRRTQFRADSVLFKTRLSPTEKKCYQFV